MILLLGFGYDLDLRRFEWNEELQDLVLDRVEWRKVSTVGTGHSKIGPGAEKHIHFKYFVTVS